MHFNGLLPLYGRQGTDVFPIIISKSTQRIDHLLPLRYGPRINVYLFSIRQYHLRRNKIIDGHTIVARQPFFNRENGDCMKRSIMN